MRLATKTLSAIDSAIDADQGSSFRGLLKKHMMMADDPFRQGEPSFRSHLGASMIGRDCARELWYNFHWAVKPHFEGRILRLFNRGHLEEPRFLAMLEMIDCQVFAVTEDGGQFRMQDHNGHFGSAIDGVAIGIPDLPPNTPCLTEYKTSNEKGFKKLVKSGVIECKYEHFVQMQIYMQKMGLLYAIYMCVNKNDDDLYAEIIEYDERVANQYIQRAFQIIYTTEPPPKINSSPSWFACSFCDYKQVCHFSAPVEENCRTCFQSSPSEHENRWICALDSRLLSKDDQEAGCGLYCADKCFHNKV
jgi:hypothetical protein